MNGRRRPGEAALIYARRGWPVLPCHGPAHLPGRCTCGHSDCASPAKHPRIAGGLRSATTDEEQVRWWWDHWPRANVAIRTGGESGLVVVDVDPAHGGLETLAALQQRHGDLPPGRTVRTGSGGLHLYFAHPGAAVRNDCGRRLGPGLDVRGDGGYVIAPPSRHTTGGFYRLEGHGGVIPPLPEWMALALTAAPEYPPAEARQPMPRRALGAAATRRWADAALDGELARLRLAAVGTRNNTLNRIAFRLGQIVGAGQLERSQVEALLVEGAEAIGVGAREAVATVRSGLEAGTRSPRGPANARETSVEVEMDP